MKKAIIIILLLLLAVIAFIYYKISTVKIIEENKETDEIIETIYTQDCFPRTLQQNGVTKECFEHANIGENDFCSESEIKMIKEYYQKGQDKDPLNDGSGKFCAD